MTMITIQRAPTSDIELCDDAQLVKTEGVVDNAREHTTWVEYRFPGSDVVVHRSVHVTLKDGLPLFSDVGGFSS